MLTELSSPYNAVAKSLFRGFQHTLAPQSILAGHTPGRVFVDHITRPKHALIWDGAAHLYLAGDRQDAEFHASMGKILVEVIGPEMLTRGHSYYVLLGEHPLHQNTLRILLPGRRPVPQKRRSYTFFHNQALPPQRCLPPEARIVAFNKALFESETLASSSQFVKWFRDTWQKPGLLLKHGFGSCVLIGDTLAGWCMAENVTRRSCEAGIESHPSFRRQGFAYQAARSFLIQCQQHRLKTIWICRENNRASAALAEKLGFGSQSNFIAWFGSFDDQEEQRILQDYSAQ